MFETLIFDQLVINGDIFNSLKKQDFNTDFLNHPEVQFPLGCARMDGLTFQERELDSF